MWLITFTIFGYYIIKGINLSDKPFLAITMGDPAGVGSEVTVKTLLDKSIYVKCKPFVVGNTEAIKSAIDENVELK